MPDNTQSLDDDAEAALAWCAYVVARGDAVAYAAWLAAADVLASAVAAVARRDALAAVRGGDDDCEAVADDPGCVKGLPHVSAYGWANTSEAWAEVFAPTSSTRT